MTTDLYGNHMYEESYEYDAAGNIRYTTDNCCEENSYSYTSNNRLKSYNGYNVGFDEDGNMLYFYQDGTKCSLTYDSSNRLLSAKSCKYTYNAENTRIKKVYGSTATTYVYNTVAKLSQLLVMKKGSTITKYVYGLGLIGEECNGAFKTYHFDYRGSTVALTNINGVVTNIFTYDTYGKLTEGSSSVTPFLYNGRDGVITDENGLYYMRARYYSPDLRRFVNADIVRGAISDGVTLNRYAYANCNPITNIDPLGLDAIHGTTSSAISSKSSTRTETLDEWVARMEEQKRLKAFWEAYEYIESQKSSGIHYNLSSHTHWDLGVDTDVDGDIDYYVYNYSYKKTLKSLTKTTSQVISGKVYFYVNVDVKFFENPGNKPDGFNSKTDIMIGDFTKNKNPVLYAYQAHNVNQESREHIINIMQLYDKDFNTAWNRTDDSLMVEWENHDIYSWLDKSAQDIDFDNDEEGYSSWDYFVKAVKRGWNKIFG